MNTEDPGIKRPSTGFSQQGGRPISRPRKRTLGCVLGGLLTGLHSSVGSPTAVPAQPCGLGLSAALPSSPALRGVQRGSSWPCTLPADPTHCRSLALWKRRKPLPGPAARLPAPPGLCPAVKLKLPQAGSRRGWESARGSSGSSGCLTAGAALPASPRLGFQPIAPLDTSPPPRLRE